MRPLEVGQRNSGVQHPDLISDGARERLTLARSTPSCACFRASPEKKGGAARYGGVDQPWADSVTASYAAESGEDLGSSRVRRLTEEGRKGLYPVSEHGSLCRADLEGRLRVATGQ
jgi:hypothetical protein